MQSNGEKHQPACFLAHDLVNKLSVIVGRCDLLIEKAQRQDEELAARLILIREVAKSAARDLTDHQCQLSEVIRITSAGKNLSV